MLLRRFTAIVLAGALGTATAAGPVLAQSAIKPVPAQASAAGQPAAGFTIPVSAHSAGQGSFEGVLRITRFATDGTRVVAIAILTGTLQDELGGLSSIIKNLSIPVILPLPGAAVSCDVLNLVLGPLDLNLLGLQIHLNRVVLDIVAVTGAGNLLGNLLCAITNLLNGAGALVDLINLLNQLISLLGG